MWSVLVRFVIGEPREFDGATSAMCDDALFVVVKWNPKRRKAEPVVGGTFDATAVTQAEIMKHGRATGFIRGRGRRDSN